MASRERSHLTNVNHVRRAALASKTARLRESWQCERRARLLAQLAVNAEIKQRWVEPHYAVTPQTRVVTGGPTATSQFQPRTAPFKALFEAGKISVMNALAYLVSVLGLQRLASH